MVVTAAVQAVDWEVSLVEALSCGTLAAAEVEGWVVGLEGGCISTCRVSVVFNYLDSLLAIGSEIDDIVHTARVLHSPGRRLWRRARWRRWRRVWWW